MNTSHMNTITRGISIPCKQRRPITYEKEVEDAPDARPDERLQEVRDGGVT